MRTRPYRIFQAYGIEIEYMIVHRKSLGVLPVADEVLKSMTGVYSSDFENGTIDWSNELVTHVIELKNHLPVPALWGLKDEFHKNVRQINDILENFDGMLLPSGTHPFMNPQTETKIWPHDYNEVYNIYDRLFDCKGHGWSNLQSTHMNLSFGNDDDFRRLHGAIRILLPILPAVSAGSPVLDGKITGLIDTRLEVYRHNQKRFPSIAGKIIPEPAFSEADYYSMIFDPIIHDIRPHDPGHILDHHFVNSRGAIARFDRGAIEIRIIDTQECPGADLAVCDIADSVIKKLDSGEWSEFEQQAACTTTRLSDIFLNVVHNGSEAVITDKDYLSLFGLKADSISARELWGEIGRNTTFGCPEVSEYRHTLFTEGPLSRRILKALGRDDSRENLIKVYSILAECLKDNRMFSPRE